MKIGNGLADGPFEGARVCGSPTKSSLEITFEEEYAVNTYKITLEFSVSVH